MPNRLEGLSSGLALENKAKTNNNDVELKNNLQKIKTVLSSNPSQEEINMAKNFLISLKELNEFYNANKEKTTAEAEAKLGNLRDEYEIFKETQALIFPLKPTPESSPEAIDKGSNFEKLFSETKSDMILLAKDEISNRVNEKFKDIKPAQRENIKVAIISKLTSSGIADSLVGGFSSKLKGYGDLLAKKDFASLLKIFDEDKDSAKSDKDSAGKRFMSLLDGQVNLIDSFVQKNKANPTIETVLNSPKNIELIKIDSDINSFKATTPEEEQAFFETIKTKIQSYDGKIQIAEKTKETIFEQITKLPDFVTNGISKFVAFLATIPFIGNFIKSFLGLEGKTEKDLEAELNSEFESRKSTKNLKEYGVQTGPKGEKIATQNDPKIKVLEDKDLSSVKHKDLKDFFAFCKEKQVITTEKDFWYNVLEQKKVEVTTKDGDKETKTNIDFNVNIEEKDFDTNKKPLKSFFDKLNALNIKKPEDKPQESVKPDTKTPATTVVAPIVAAGVSTLSDEEKARNRPGFTPEENIKAEAIRKRDIEIRQAILLSTIIPVKINYSSKDKSVEYPEIVSFDSTSQILNIGNQKYKFSISDFKTKVPLLGEIEVKNAKIDGINISGENFIFASSGEAAGSRRNGDPISKSKKEIGDLTCMLLNNGRFTMKDGNKQINIIKV